jgi:hypothetical protein
MLNRFADIWICLFEGELGIYMYRDEEATPRFFPHRQQNLAPFACCSSSLDVVCRAGFCCAPASYFLDLTSCSRPLT